MLSKFSVKKPYTVLVTVLLILILGVVSFTEMTPDLLPSIELPYVVVMTTYVGASPEEVETTVTKPVEQSLATLNNIENVSSTSSENMSMVVLEFAEDTNMDAIGVDIREKLDAIKGYWNDSVGSPLVMKLNPDMMPVMVAAVDGEGMNTIEASSYVEEEILPALESTEGVASVMATGLVENQIQVVINEKKIDKLNKKIEKAINKQMQEAEEKLENAKSKISSGKKELEQKNIDLAKGMTQASQALTTARMEILKNEIKMADSGAELQEKEAELQKAEQELQEKEAELQKAEQELSKKKKEFSEKEENSIKQEEEALTGIKQELIAARKQLEEGKAALIAGKEQFTFGAEQIKEGKAELNQKEEQLEEKKSSSQTQINNASGQLTNGEKELENQLDAFDETKESTLKAARVEDKITSDMVSSILQAQNFSMPAGYVQEEGADYLVRVGDKLKDLDEIKNLVLFDLNLDGIEAITLEDAADVFWKDNAQETYAKINGNPGVMLSFQKQTSYKTATVADSLHEKFDEISHANPDIHFTTLMDQGIYIHMVIDSVLNNLVMGGILAILILLIFLRDIKPTAIIACSIPISVIFAIVLMYFSGVTLNIISLSGLAVGVGMLVDNSIVVIENIYRLRNKGVSPIKAAITGAAQVSGAIISSTLTTVSVFLPIVFIKGISRQLFMDMALTIGYSLIASLIIALTVVPAMSSKMLRETKEKKHGFLDGAIGIYEKVLKGALRVKPLVLLLAVGILVGSIFGAMKNGTAFMEEMDSTQISVAMQMPQKTTLEDTVAMSDQIIEKIQQIEDVDTVGAMLSGGNGGMGGNTSTDAVSIYALLKENKKHTSQEIAGKIEEACKDFPCELKVSASNMDMSALGGSGVTIEVRGAEIDTLKSLANEVASSLEKVEGTQNISNGIEDATEEIRIVVDKEKAMKKGFTVAQVYGEIKNAIADAAAATELSMEGSEYEILVLTDKKESMSREDIKNYVMKTTDANGKEKKVKLKNIANITEDYSLSTISRDSQQRYLSVTSEIKEGYNIGNVSKDVKKMVDKIEIPSGYKVVYTGENETINEALYQMVKMLLLAIAFIYLIMVAQFQSLLSPFIVMFTIPLAFTGGFLGLLITGKEVSVIAALGFVMLSGVVVNNGIVLVDYTNQLRREGTSKKEAIIEAGKTRMRPILMTALTTILGLSTMAFGIGMGSEMMQPIAIVTIGGLLYATITTLFVIPVLYDLFHRKEMKIIAKEELELYKEEV
ncbi:MAG: efflux RND transporter permease subunit [Acetivibrio sp.]